MKNVLIISGSPRKGNTDFILNEIYNSLEDEKELILLRDKNIKHCCGCLYCDENNKCSIQDDMQGLYAKILKADVLVFGSPNYFDNVSGLMKDFIDRTNPFYETDVLKDKKAITVVVGGGDIKNSKRVGEKALKYFIEGHNMKTVGNYYFQALHADELEKDSKTKEKLIDIKTRIEEIL